MDRMMRHLFFSAFSRKEAFRISMAEGMYSGRPEIKVSSRCIESGAGKERILVWRAYL